MVCIRNILGVSDTDLPVAGERRALDALGYNGRLDARLWLVTYPFYLTHEVIGGALLHYLGNSGLARPVSLGLAILSALSVAHLISAYGEPRLRDAVVQVARRVKAVVAARKTA